MCVQLVAKVHKGGHKPLPVEKGESRRWNGYFAEYDRAAILFLMEHGHHSVASDAIRKAITLQHQRDSFGKVSVPLAKLYRRFLPYESRARGDHDIRDHVMRKRIRTGEKMRRMFVWFNDLDMDRLREIAAIHGLRGLSEAVRLAIRVEAALEGYDAGDTASDDAV